MRYFISIEEYDGECRTEYAEIVVNGDNLPTKDSIEVVNGVAVFTMSDTFETLVENIRQTVCNMAENPGEVSVRHW